MTPALEPEFLTTLSTLKNDISSAVPNPSGRIPDVLPVAEAESTVAVWPVLVRSSSVKFSAIWTVSGVSDSVWLGCSVTVATVVMLNTGLSSVPVTVTFTVWMAVPPWLSETLMS